MSNTGSVEGQEVAQLYASFPRRSQRAGAPAARLRKGRHPAWRESDAPVTFELVRRDLSVWDTAGQEWKVESGDYTFWVGASTRDLKAKAALTVQL